MEEENNFSLFKINITEVEENFNKVANDFLSDFKDIGFAVVYGVEDCDGDELLKWTMWFFNLPLQNKNEHC